MFLKCTLKQEKLMFRSHHDTFVTNRFNAEPNLPPKETQFNFIEGSSFCPKILRHSIALHQDEELCYAHPSRLGMLTFL